MSQMAGPQTTRFDGGHASLAYETEAGFRAVAVPFVLAGLRADERVVCLLHDHTETSFLEALRERDGEPDLDAALARGQLEIRPARDHYVPDGVLEPESVLERLEELHETALEHGWPGLRLLGETGFLREMESFVDDWVRYEWLVEEELPRTLTALCVYPARRLDPAALNRFLEPHDVRLVGEASGTIGEAVERERVGELLSGVLAVLEEAVFVVAYPERRVLASNPAAERMFGYGAGEMVGEPTLRLHVSEESAEAFGEHVRDAFDRGEDLRTRWRMRRADGTAFRTSHTVRPVGDPDAGSILVVSVVRDLSEREAREREIRRGRERLRALMSRMISLQEEERREVARELHDEVGALLASVRSRVGTLEHELGEGDDPNALELVEEAGRLADESLGRLRGLLESLRPPMLLGEVGLVSAIERDVERRCEAEGLECAVTAGDGPYPLGPDAASACFRVVQEALTNVIRHAEATRVEVSFERGGGGLLVTVRDDGRGFELNTDGDGARSKASLGILGMHERAKAVGGEIAIESRAGEGTAIRLSLPLATGD